MVGIVFFNREKEGVLRCITNHDHIAFLISLIRVFYALSPFYVLSR